MQFGPSVVKQEQTLCEIHVTDNTVAMQKLIAGKLDDSWKLEAFTVSPTGEYVAVFTTRRWG